MSKQHLRELREIERNCRAELEKDTTLTSYNKKWIELLCHYGNRLEYDQVLNKSINNLFAIMAYRKILRSRGFGNVPYLTLEHVYAQKDYNKLHDLLQDLFLEYITDSQYEIILRILNNTEDGLLKLYNKHFEVIESRILYNITII